MSERISGPEQDTLVGAPTPESGPPLEGREQHGEIGRVVGRYVILALLGEGAMGIVFAAYDPNLDRKVALKRLRARSHRRRTVAESRLRREAQALARLNHANVVTVHEVAIYEAELYIVMEFVEGQTLRQWLSKRRPWREVVEVFVAAGAGLQAAHEQGLVHRDFKPDNVMIGRDGRVRVMDFGLARIDEELSEDSLGAESGDGALASESINLRLTRTGARLGTPAYMAPEQFTGATASPLSDQFSFCVSLYEALYGARPFPGSTYSELSQSVVRGRVQAPPRNAPGPGWLARVITRGLAREPERRHPSMAALLDDLTHDPRRKLWWGLGLSCGAMALVGAIGLGAALDADPIPEVEVCGGFEGHLEGIWDPTRRGQVESGLRGTELSYAVDTWARVEAGLDDYTQRWLDARRRACMATHIGEQSERLLDRRMACLDRNLAQVRATVDVLTEPDAEVLRNAVTLIRRLPSLDDCADADALGARLRPDDPELAREVERLEDSLTQARVSAEVGRVEPTLERLGSIVEQAEALGHEPFEVRAHLAVGRLALIAHEHESAEFHLRRAYEGAVGLVMVHEAAEAAIQLTELLGRELARYEDAEGWEDQARPWTRAAAAGELHGEYLTVLGMIARDRGQFQEARDTLEKAVSTYEAHHGPEHPDVASARIALGITEARLGNNEHALAHFERALVINERTHGPNHPLVGSVLNNLALLSKREGDDAKTRAYLERAAEVFRNGDASSPALAVVLSNLGELELRTRDYADAREHLSRALELSEAAYGSEHPKLVAPLAGLGRVETAQGELETAQAHLDRALAMVHATKGEDHSEAAKVHGYLATLARAKGEDEGAAEHLDRALAIFEDNFGGQHDSVAMTLLSRGNIALDTGEPRLAQRDFARAASIWEAREEEDSTKYADALTGLGRASAHLGELTQACESLERAVELYERDAMREVSAGGLALVRLELAEQRWSLARADPELRSAARAEAEVALDELEAALDEPNLTSPELERLRGVRAELRTWIVDHPR